MSSIGVVVFRNSPLGKAQVLQESVNNSLNITNNDRADKSVRRDIVIVRKKCKVEPPLSPNAPVSSLVHTIDAGSSGIPSKRPRIREVSGEEIARTPTPLAVARRNARERNRVRQVNDGFAALRRHIPEEVAAAFENANSNRGPNKKLSKVETLRMAVEYIRNLESLLNIGHADKENSNRQSIDSFPSPASSVDNSQEKSYFSINSPALDEEDIDEDEIDGSMQANIRHNYLDIPSTEFQLVSTPHLYEEEDGSGQPMTPSSDFLGNDEVSAHILESHFPFPSSAEQFTIIPEQTYCSEIEHANENEFDVKYSENIQEIHNSFDNGSLTTMNPDLILSESQYKFKNEDNIIFDNQQYIEMELKKELPDIQVTPEDREQFEETLKWWQEKTRQTRLSPKSKN